MPSFVPDPSAPLRKTIVWFADDATILALTCDDALAPLAIALDTGNLYKPSGGSYVILAGYRVTGFGTPGVIPMWDGTGAALVDSNWVQDPIDGSWSLDALETFIGHGSGSTPVLYFGADKNHALLISRDATTGIVTITTASGSPVGSFAFGRGVAVTGNITGSNLSGTNTGDNPPSDTAYGSGWNGVTTIAPSKNAVYDQMELRQPLDAGLTSHALLPTAADKIAYSTAADVWAEAAITSAGRSLVAGADAAAQRATVGALYGIPFACALNGPIASGNTYYFGTLPRTIANSTTAATNKILFRRAGVIRFAHILMYANSVAGSNENISAYVRLNNASDTLIQTVGTSAAERVFDNDAINITVAPGDYIEIKIVAPTWSTAPTSVTFTGYLLVE
jgi:hypothetical protein